MIKIIDHDLLLCKRECYDGLVDNELPWFKNYLKSRKQVVCCNGSTLNPKDVQIGVLQGNVLGLILFLKMILCKVLMMFSITFLLMMLYCMQLPVKYVK